MLRLFRHYVPILFLVLAFVEITICFLSIYIGKSLRHISLGLEIPNIVDYIPESLAFAVVAFIMMNTMGLYHRKFVNSSNREIALQIVGSFLLALLAMALIYYLFPNLYLGRGEFGLGFATAIIGVFAARIIYLRLSGREILKRRVLVLGAGHKAAQFESLLSEACVTSVKLVGYVPLYGEDEAVQRTKILRLSESLLSLAQANEVDEIVVAPDDRRKAFPVQQILECKLQAIDVSDLLDFFERESGKLRLEALHPSSMIFSDGFRKPLLKVYAKRAYDVAIAVLFLATTWPIMLLAALAIWIESGFQGPIFYRQERVGQDGRTFPLFKFRSMQVDAEGDGIARWAMPNDDRITRVGGFIRRTRIDELPQLFNVMHGQMSFVGPRPERPQFVTELIKTIPFYSVRHSVKPGITGWAQIQYPYGASEADAIEKLQYDLYYIKNYSLFLDILVLLRTGHVVLWRKGSR